MGWESGCFPASVMMTWTGLWPSEVVEGDGAGGERKTTAEGVRKSAQTVRREWNHGVNQQNQFKHKPTSNRLT